MTNSEASYWNAKHDQFFLTRFSPITSKFIQVGKPRSTIQDALAAAAKLDARNGKFMTFIDTKAPRS